MKSSHLTPRLISAGGLLIILVELMLHWLYHNDVGLVVLLVGGFVMWYGGFIDNRKAALEGGGFVVDSIVKIGSVFRLTNAKPGGNRAEDKSSIPTVVIPTAAAPTHDPSTAAPPQVEWEHGHEDGVI